MKEFDGNYKDDKPDIITVKEFSSILDEHLKGIESKKDILVKGKENTPDSCDDYTEEDEDDDDSTDENMPLEWEEKYRQDKKKLINGEEYIIMGKVL